MTNETSVERRLRGQADVFRRTPGMRWSKEEQEAEADAIDCGREAIRLLREYATINHVDDGAAFDVAALALLARCTEGPR